MVLTELCYQTVTCKQNCLSGKIGPYSAHLHFSLLDFYGYKAVILY